jgi:hypothetical protein
MQREKVVAAIAQSDAPAKWKRYCEIAPGVLRRYGRSVSAADAPLELLQGRMRRGAYDSRAWGDEGDDLESYRLETEFLALFAAAVRELRCHVCGVPDNEIAEHVVPAGLITDESVRGLKGDRWENLAGRTWSAIRVSIGPPPSVSSEPQEAADDQAELPTASEEQVRAAFDAICTHREKVGLPPLNLNKMRKPAQKWLRDRKLYADQDYIRQLFRDPLYKNRRARPGPRRRKSS